MASVNKVILIGNLGQDPEVRSFPSGGQIANLRIATTDKWKDRQSGEQREHTEWHTVVFNDRLAEIAAQYLRKGSAVYVEGSLRPRKWQDQNGNDRYSTEIRGQTLQMLGARSGGGSSEGAGYNNGNEQSGGGNPYNATAPARSNDQGYGNKNAPAARPASSPVAPASQPSSFDNFADDDIPF